MDVAGAHHRASLSAHDARGPKRSIGGIGAMHLMGQKLGLAEEIDARVQLLKRHLPYHESDHVLNLATMHC